MNDWRLGIEALGGVLITLLITWIGYQKWLRPRMVRETAADRKYKLEQQKLEHAQDMEDKRLALEHEQKIAAARREALELEAKIGANPYQIITAQFSQLSNRLDAVHADLASSQQKVVLLEQREDACQKRLAQLEQQNSEQARQIAELQQSVNGMQRGGPR